MYSISCSSRILIKLEFSQQIFEKRAKVKFNQNPSSGSRDVLYGRTEGQADATKLMVAFRNFANTPHNKLCGQNTKFLNVKPAGT